MIYAAIIAALAALAAFGAVLYRSGRAAAENKAFKTEKKQNEKVDKAIKRASGLSRVELLERLRDGEDP